ncbi:MAG TPA: sugar phosphate isomerase/epimerase [Chryseolinea sp.]|nr:sugar phosphate isomerase/epimerase [Chryseolinea sp.]
MGITRRDFIIQSTAALSTTLIAPAMATSIAKYKMGLQLFTLNSILTGDVAGIMKKVAAIGYEDCETYGYDPDQGTYYKMKASAFKQVLSDNKLITTSGHYDFAKYFDKSVDDMKRFVDQCIQGAHTLGQKYITWPWLDPQSRTIEKFKILTGKLNAIGEQVNKAGLGFAYHNHNFEFVDFNGENGYDIVMRETDPKLVKLQIDMYWVMHSSKLSPAELISKQPGRFVMWHIKDMDKVTRDYSELGNGSIDYTKILPEASRAGLQYYYIEQGGNFQISPMDSITQSAAFFKKNLERYLS